MKPPCVDISANPGMIPRTSHPFNSDILVYMSVLNTELLRHPGLSWVILRHLKATLDNPHEHRLTERQESVEISNSEGEGTSASEECICIEKQEDAETSNSEGERTSVSEVVEWQELDEESSSEEERVFTDNEHRLVERQKLAQTSKSTSTEVNKNCSVKKKIGSDQSVFFW